MIGTMLDKAKLEDVPESYKELAEILGMDAFKRLVMNYGGTEVYIPVDKSITRNIRNNILRRTFNGDYKQSAKTYRMSQAQVRKIIKNKSK